MAAPDPYQILRTLYELCSSRVPMALMSRDLLVVCHGHFTSLAEDALTLEFDVRPTGLGFSPPAFCVGSFNQNERPHLFTTRIKINNENDGTHPARVIVEVPSAMRWPESRMAVRLPVPPNAPLHVRITTAEHQLGAAARDISLCGALIQLTEPAPPELVAGERILLEAELQGQTMKMPAIVRRRDPPRYGLYFPDSVTEGRLNPSKAWRLLVDGVSKFA